MTQVNIMDDETLCSASVVDQPESGEPANPALFLLLGVCRLVHLFVLRRQTRAVVQAVSPGCMRGMCELRGSLGALGLRTSAVEY